MRKFMGNNKGLSLVELLIALVIGSILVAGIGSIMVVSSRSFSSTSAEAAMQSSAQIVMDHIQDVVVDANQKVLYSYTTSPTRPTNEADWTKVAKDSAIPDPESSITFKRLSVYAFNLNQISSPDAYNQEENKHYDIIWQHNMTDDEDSEIWFEQQNLTYDPTIKDVVEVGGSLVSEKLADNVKSFKCDLSDMETKRIIYVEMDFSKAGGRYEYHVANNISLRNKVALSTDSITVSPSVNLVTMSLTAEPGMDLPLTIKNIITKGNASNTVVYELAGGDGGRTSGGTDLINPTTLRIDAKEKAATIRMNAIDSMGGRTPFDVYINRVKWTNNNAADLGESGDDVEGIELIDRPEHDEVDAGTVVPITVKLNSNPGAPGIDRTRPENVTAEIKSVTLGGATPANAGSIKLNEAGSLGWMLEVPVSILKDTKITIRFTAGHSLANGGIATRTVPYPGTDGVYKDLVLTVTEAGPAVSKSPFLRGMIDPINYYEYLRQFFNDAGDSELERFRNLPSRNSTYVVWKEYAYRPAVDGSKNHYYSSDSDGWIITHPGALTERYDNKQGYIDNGWSSEFGDGSTGNFHGDEFTINPDHDTWLVFAIVASYNNGANWFSTTPAQTVMYGFREMISNGTTGAKYDKAYYLGSFYKLDTDTNNENIGKNMIGSKDDSKWYIWQKEACFDNLSKGNNSNPLKMNTVISEGGQSTDVPYYYLDQNYEANPEYNGPEVYMGDHIVYMARSVKMRENKDSNLVPVKQVKDLGASDKEKDYYIWPRFLFNRNYFERTSGSLHFKVKHGNITLKDKADSTKRMEGFVPYPAYTTDDGFSIPEHPDFYNLGSGEKTINHYNNEGNRQSTSYRYSMRKEGDVYYLTLTGLADYKFDSSTERWEFVRSDNVDGNLVSGLYSKNGRDVFLPGPDDKEFFTGFKNIMDQANTDKKWADGMTIYKAYEGVSSIGSHRIAYYRQDRKYCVDIYTLGGKSVFKKYVYDEASKQWESKGDLFAPNVDETFTIQGKNRNFKLYLPTAKDPDWAAFIRQDTGGGMKQASTLKVYRYQNNKWSEYLVNSEVSLWYSYNQGTGVLRMNIQYEHGTDRWYRYDSVNDRWIKE